MAEIAAWNGHTFTVSPQLIRSFTGLTIKGSSETENKTGDGQKYVSRKSSSPHEITLTAELNALTGCDVKNEALEFVDEARLGAKNYFYMGGKKLITCQLMLTEASVSETVIAPNGAWVSCKVRLVMKQCTNHDGLSSKKASKKTSEKASLAKTLISRAVAFVESENVTEAAKAANKKSSISSSISKIVEVTTTVNKAKAASALAKGGRSMKTKLTVHIR